MTMLPTLLSGERDLPDTDATETFGRELAARLEDGAGGVIYLHGELGAGKTTLVRALLRALGVTGAIRSPTYTLMEPYELGSCRVLHMDLYRLEAADLEQLGLDDYPPAETLWLVEWPEKGGQHLPAADIELHLSVDGRGRRLAIRRP